jgi:hypothetical protein
MNGKLGFAAIGWLLVLLTLSVSWGICGWEEHGSPICTAFDDQFEPQITSDGAGGAIITWKDYRNHTLTLTDIYARRVDASGNVLWTADGVAICTVTNGQGDPEITSDGSGGAIITWTDARGGSPNIYVQRVDASGNSLWTADGVAICTAVNSQGDPEVTSDGTGGAVITWEDNRSDDNDLYVQRVDASGNLLWTADGVAICTATGNQFAPQIATDGAGGAIMTWRDYRTGDPDIYAQRVDASGNVPWTADGVAICTDLSQQHEAQITSDGMGGAIIAWRDTRGGISDVYVQRVDASGDTLWAADGIRVCPAMGNEYDLQLVSDEAGGAIITWRDSRSGTNDIYVQRVDASGNVHWTADGVAICTATADQYEPQITSDGAGGALVTWHDDRTGNTDIYVQRVDASGNLLWTADGVAICTVPGNQDDTQITSDGAGGAIITWRDHRTGAADVYAQSCDRNGYWGYPAPEIQVARDIPQDEGGYVTLAWDASRLDPWPHMLITHYTVWRAIDRSLLGSLDESHAVLLLSFSDAGPEVLGTSVIANSMFGGHYYWQLLTTTDAYHFAGYSEVVPTAFDSTSASMGYSWFQVVAHSGDSLYWVSLPDSGYSVDNNPPGQPIGLAGEYADSQLVVTWHPNTEEDLSHYAVYKGTSEYFVPDESNRIAELTDTLVVDETFDPAFESCYKVSAWDIHENESDFSILTGEQIGGVSGKSHATVLYQNEPNPFAPGTVVRFSLAERAHVRLRVFDVQGRPVRTLINETREPDSYTIGWDGTSDDGHQVAPGIYVCRLETQGISSAMKMVRLR